MSNEKEEKEFQENNEFHVPKSTWTHIALHAKNIDKMIAWYEQYTHLTLLYKEEDENGDCSDSDDSCNTRLFKVVDYLVVTPGRKGTPFLRLPSCPCCQ